jgi:hypothetical protein
VLKNQITHQFKIKDLGPICLFLGMQITRDRKNQYVYINPTGYIKIIEWFGMHDSKPISILAKKPLLRKRYTTAENFDQKKYQEGIDSINSPVITTWPDISFMSRLLGRFIEDPSMIH